jgi:DNA-binding winged helix-turn-helix (wHTH) protein/Tfp pilus assembly protein PilF
VNTEAELEFDGWKVNRISGEIVRDGNASRLAQQPLRILLELADRAGAIATREELVKALWPRGIIDFDNGLNVAVRKLRVALDDIGPTPKYIETVPRVGYRFIGLRSAESQTAIEPILTPPALSRVALVLTLAALGLAIAGAGWWTVSSSGSKAAIPAAHVPSVRARELYLDGIHQRSRRDISVASARALATEKFEAALKEDPNYAQAWAALAASIYVSVVNQTIPPAAGVPKARAAALRAIALDDNLADGHVSLSGIYLAHDRNFAAAKKELDRALELDGKSSRAWHNLALWHADLGQVDEALAALRRAREIEPMVLQLSGNYARVLYSARRYEEAIDFLKPLVAANPHFYHARSVLGWALIATGDLAGAEEQLRLVTDPGINQSNMGFLYAKLGRRDDALREIERLEERGREGHGVAYDLTIIYSALGELDRGCETLARAVDDHSVLLVWMRLDPRLDPLRGRQCFADVEKRVYPR